MREVEQILEELRIKPILDDSFCSLDDTEIEQLESRLERSLPEEYKFFLKRYGVSTFEDSVGFIPLVKLPPHISNDRKGYFDYFYGSAEADYDVTLTLQRNLTTYAGRVPENIIPIGSDIGGNLVCLGIKGDQEGKIYYWDAENEQDQEEYLESRGSLEENWEFHNVYLISNTFKDFLMCLEVLADV